MIRSALNKTEDFQESYYLKSDFQVERVYFRLSECFAALNEKEKAVEMLKKAVVLGFDDINQFQESNLLNKVLSNMEIKKCLESM